MPLSSEIIHKTICIEAPTTVVWNYLTNTDLMKQWMLDSHMSAEISTSWEPGIPMHMKGTMHGMSFENNGTVLNYVPEKLLEYNHLSSLSQLNETPENFTRLTFTLTPEDNYTKLSISISNFPTESILKHLNFYWRTTLVILKEKTEHHFNS